MVHWRSSDWGVIRPMLKSLFSYQELDQLIYNFTGYLPTMFKEGMEIRHIDSFPDPKRVQAKGCVA